MTDEAYLRVFKILSSKLLRPTTIIVCGFVLVSLIFFRPLMVSLILIALGAVSIIYKRHVSIGIDLELCSLCAIAIGSRHGVTAGAVSGGVSILLALLLNGHFMENPFFAAIKMITYAGLGSLAAIFATSNLTFMAGAYTFVADAIFVVIAIQTGGNVGKLIVFLITHPLIVIYQLKLLLPLARALL